MVIFEYVVLEVFELLVAKGTSMVTVDSLLNARPAIYMTAPGDITVIDGVETNRALELCL